MAAKLNITEVIIGDDFSIPMTLRDGLGNPIDLSGRTFWITLKANPNVPDSEADAQAMLTAPNDGTSQAGEVYPKLSNEDTASLKPTSYYYDVQMKTSTVEGDEIRTLLYGKVRFVPQITRSS